MVHVPMREQHAIQVLDSAIVRVVPVAFPQIRFVGPKIVAVDSLERLG
jgi:hypothetical protein